MNQRMKAQRSLGQAVQLLNREDVLIESISLNKDQRIIIVIAVDDHKRLFVEEPFNYDCCTKMLIHHYGGHCSIVARIFEPCMKCQDIAMKWAKQKEE